MAGVTVNLQLYLIPSLYLRFCGMNSLFCHDHPHSLRNTDHCGTPHDGARCTAAPMTAAAKRAQVTGLVVTGAAGTEPCAEPGLVLPCGRWRVLGSAVCKGLVVGVACGPGMGRFCDVVLGPCDGGPMSGEKEAGYWMSWSGQPVVRRG
jgi:hypothetical protein